MAYYEQVTANTPDGAQVGQSATEKVGFWGAIPVAQPAGSAQAALTLTTATSNGFGFATSAAFNAFTAQLEEIRASLVEIGILKGAA